MLWWCALHFAIAVAGTWLARRYALRRKLIDQPGERRSHSVATPRGGGIAIVIVLLVAAVALVLKNPQQIVLLAAFVVGLVLVAGVGLIDDHRSLSPWLRLAVHAMAAAVFALGTAGAYGDPLTALVAFIAVMVLSNVWNFMDGINGIAASQAALVSASLFIALGGPWAWLSLALVAACVGFLPFNFPRARIFLGDVGSGALGYALAALLVVAYADHAMPQALLALPLSAFLVDSGLTLLRRLSRGERWWTPHTQHAYQGWAARLRAHAPVTLGYAGWTTVAGLLAWWLKPVAEPYAVALVFAWYTVAAYVWWRLQGRMWTVPLGSKEMDKE
ncbi:MAG TPA: hypothetical protein VGD21_05530 [Lysobacter sp.]